MRTLFKIVGLFALLMLLGFAVSAQVPKTAPGADPPEIPEDTKKLLSVLQNRALGLEEAKAVLQKEIDSVTAEWNRQLVRLQANAPPGYELSPGLVYVKKKEEVKK